MQRHLLDPVGALSVPRVVSRLCGVQTQVASSAELAIRVRRQTSRRGEAGRVLFAHSLAHRTTKNDADRLRKYLARFGLTFEQLR